uniref:Retrovirus-related Pol polyprotein from transposon TNT 1-94 n=1 Tax=Tanacetum cinerariifolium TaxID=118510 RepID=A0A699H7K9_TANCI|nr:retrovirus-related Pol polyprotein from transposon TNT 1-94 [Tanacetum cinerariifolium]
MATLNSMEIKERFKAKGDDGEGLYVRGRTDRRDSRQSREKSRSKSRGGRLKCYIYQSDDHLKRNCLKNHRKKSIGYVKKDEQPSSSGSTYDDSELGDNKECKMRGISKVRVQLKDGSSFVLHNVRVILSGIRRDNCVYYLDGHAMAGELNASVKEKDNLAHVWHKRLGHISEAGLHVLEKHGLFGKKSLDLWDPSQVESLGGKRYFLSIVNDYSNRLRTDNGLEFCNREFEQLCIKSGIAIHLTVAGTPQQNRVAKRMNRTLMDKVCYLLIKSGLPKTFWAEATSTAAYLIKRSPSRAIEKKTPMEMWSGHPTDYRMLMIFDCAAYPHDNQAKEENTHEPLTYQKAVACKDNSKWKAAMKEEINSLKKNKTYELVDHPAGQKLMSYTCLFKIKEGIKDELLLERIEEMKDKIRGLGNGRVIIQRYFDRLKTKLEEARTQIAGLQKKQMGHDDEVVLARVRISTLEMIIEDI